MGEVVFWPRRGSRAALAPCELLGFRPRDHVFCVVALAEEEQQARAAADAGAERLGRLGCDSVDPISPATLRARLASDSTEVPVVDAGGERGCSVVLYDAGLAASGCFARCSRALSPSSAFRAPLAQIGEYFETRLEQEQALARDGSASAIRRLLELVGFYAVFLPSLALQRVSGLVNDVVTGKIPLPIPTSREKRVKDVSSFLEVLGYYLHSLAHTPSVVRSFYLTARRRGATDDEVARVVEASNFACFVAMDFALGHLLSRVVFQIVAAWLQSLELSPTAFLEILRANVVWLMGAPAGFKLNAPLASILGNGIVLWFDLWEFALSLLIDADTPWSGVFENPLVVHFAASLWRNIGATLQLTLLADTLAFLSWNSYWVYQYFTKLNMLQFGLFSSLWKLFLGKKNNVLRKRVDSCEYDVSQLLLGTLLFTILFFIVTTNMVFFVYFGLVRLSVFSVRAVLWLPVVLLRTLPVASIVYRYWRPAFFVTGVRLDARADLTLAIETLDIRDVGVGRQRASDSEYQQRITEIVRGGATVSAHDEQQTPGSTSKCAYFQLVPIVSSAGSLFSRLRAYLKALTTQYSVGAVTRSWFFGSHISSISMTILFDPLPEKFEAGDEAAVVAAAAASAKKLQ